MTGQKKIYKITEKEYWTNKTPSGEIVFLPPLPDDVPFKCVMTYDADNKPCLHNYYNRDGTVYCSWARKMPDPLDWLKDIYRTVETRTNDNGQVIYERRESCPDQKGEAWFISQQRFYEYRNGILFREKAVRELSPKTADYDNVLLVDKGYTLPLIDCWETFYNEKGDEIIYRQYEINSCEIRHESTCRYLYDHYGNMIYREDIDSSGAVWCKTNRTIKYWETRGKQVGDYLFSHAGVSYGWYKNHFIELMKRGITIEDQLNNYFQDSKMAFDEVGAGRGNRDGFGSPLWADLSEIWYETKHFNPNIFQIVGHSYVPEGEEPYINTHIACLDDKQLHLLKDDIIELYEK